jgi:hypothetical protein
MTQRSVCKRVFVKQTANCGKVAGQINKVVKEWKKYPKEYFYYAPWEGGGGRGNSEGQ